MEAGFDREKRDSMAQPAGAGRRRLRIGDAIALFLATALTGYWAWTYTGVYRWLAELQLRMMHQYEVQLTFVLALLVACVPFFFISAIARRAIFGYQDPANLQLIAAAKQKASPPSPLRIPLWTAAIFALIGAGLVIAGAYQKHRGQSAGQMVQATAAYYASGHPPAGDYISVSGFSVPGATQSFQSGDSAAKYYAPLVPPNWTSDKPVGMFLETDVPNMMPTNYYQRSQIGGSEIPEIWQGMTDPEGLPGAVRAQFEQEHLALADGYRLLSVGETPQNIVSEGQTVIYAGSAVAVVSILAGLVSALFILWRQRVRHKTTAPPLDPRLEIVAIDGRKVPRPPPLAADPAPTPQSIVTTHNPNSFSLPRLILAIVLVFFGSPLAIWMVIAAMFIGTDATKGQASWIGVFVTLAIALLGAAMIVGGLAMGIRETLRGWRVIRDRR
jgi:hypothetical protein